MIDNYLQNNLHSFLPNKTKNRDNKFYFLVIYLFTNAQKVLAKI